MFIGLMGIVAYHDTGSSITLHTKSFRQKLPQGSKEHVSKVATRYNRFMGIKGKETTVLTDIYKWNLGWKENQQNTTIYSVEIPDGLLNIQGMHWEEIPSTENAGSWHMRIFRMT